MPPPGNSTEFLTVVEKSGLLKEDDLERYRFQSAADPSPPDRVAKWMLMDGRLTQFQIGLLLAGKTRPFFIGPYKILSRIGNGSMGVVYLCEHQFMSRKVALKILQKRRTHDAVAIERFLREARAAATLDHPNVVHALDFGFEHQLHYMVMEYVDGRSLKAIVLAEGALQPLKVAGYLRQAALGLQHAHEAGLIHRDIKPSNLMINRSGVLKLLDLGLARFNDNDVDLTQGNPLGTLAYVAPEQAKDSHTVDARADIYSLGATFYLALTGRSPKPGIGIGDAVPPELTDPNNFERIMTVLRRMTARKPSDRFQKAAEVAAEMDVLLTPPAPTPIELPRVEPETIDSDELNAVESHENLLGDTPSDELVESKTEEPKEFTPVENATVETVESTALEEETPSKPVSVEQIELEQVEEVQPITKHPSKPTILPNPKPRLRKRPERSKKKGWQARYQSAQWWVDRNLKAILMVLAVVVGLLAALSNRHQTAKSKDLQPETKTEPVSQN